MTYRPDIILDSFARIGTCRQTYWLRVVLAVRIRTNVEKHAMELTSLNVNNFDKTNNLKL